MRGETMFEDIVKNAKTNANIIGDDGSLFSNEKVRIAVVGVGGGGCNTVNRIAKTGIKSARTIAINTDKVHLDIVKADTKVLIGSKITRGLGAGGFPEVGLKCAEVSRNTIREALGENELVFLTAGMGGGTGTGAAPVVAQIAKEQGAIVVGIVTYPFRLERARLKKAEWGIRELAKECDTLIIIDNNRLVQYAPNLPVNKAFELADMITARAVKGISDTIMFPSLMNIDYADVKTVMENGGLAMISIGEGTGPDRVEEVVKSTLTHPLLDVDYEGAKGALIHITGGPGLTLGEGIEIGERLTQSFDPDANVKIGARLTPEMGERIYVTMITTGIKSPYIMSEHEQSDVPAVTRETMTQETVVEEAKDLFYL